MTELAKNPQNQPVSNPAAADNAEVKKRPFRIGIIVNLSNLEDIAYYNEQFREINKLFPTKINLLFMGYKPEDDKDNALEGVNFDFVKPVSIIHYFKQLKSLKIDLLFVPLIQNIYNATSENYNKYLEAGLYGIPVLAPDIYPYNKVIRNEQNGFIFQSRETFIPYLKNLLGKQFPLIKHCGTMAHKEITEELNYSNKNIRIISGMFDLQYDEDETESEEQPQESQTPE